MGPRVVRSASLRPRNPRASSFPYRRRRSASFHITYYLSFSPARMGNAFNKDTDFSEAPPCTIGIVMRVMLM